MRTGKSRRGFRKTMNPVLGMRAEALALRRRSVWEALDSGILLWRKDFIYFIPFFAIPVWLIACGLRLLPAELHYLSYLVLWWLKPLFDRLLLHVVSRRFFGAGEEPLIENTAGAAHTGAAHTSGGMKGLRRGLVPNLFRGLFGDLLWRRFSPHRGARMPIRVLEHSRGKQFTMRKKALAAGGLKFCAFTSFLGLMIEAVLLIGEIIFALVMIQMFFPSAMDNIRENLGTIEIFIFIAFCFNFILAESLYVCMGFGLYINSRVEVEGWDLQLLFQKFSGSRRSAPASVTRIVLIVCLFLVPLFGPGQSGLYADSDESLRMLHEILASKDFGYERDGWRIQLKPPDKDLKLPNLESEPWMEKLKYVFSFIVRFLVILALAAFAAYALNWFWKNYGGSFRLKESGRKKGYVGPLLSPESPEKLFAQAEELFNLGKIREAWAACLSGCIGAYTQYHSLSFPADTTEYGCLDLVRRAFPGKDEGFGDLVQCWILFAYGGRVPAGDAFEKALVFGRSLCSAPELP